jgi:hypothetical protein
MTRSVRRGHWKAFGVAAGTGFALFYWLMQDEFLRGLDAYYYALQADFWVKTGRVRIPDSSIVHRLIGTLQWFGLRTEAAIRLWTSIALSLVVLTLAVAAPARTFSLRGEGIPSLLRLPLNWRTHCLLAWGVASPSLLFLGLEFPKMFLFAVSLSLWPLSIVAGRLEFRRLIPFATLSVILHKAAFGYLAAVVVVAGCLFIPSLIRTVSSQPGARRKIGQILGVAFVGGVATALFYRLSIIDALSMHDLERIRLETIIPGCLSLLVRQGLPLAVRLELAMSLFGLGVLLYKLRKTSPVQRLLPLVLILPSFMPAGGTEAFSLGERFGILLPLAVILSWITLARCNLTFTPAGSPAELLSNREMLALILLGALLAPYRLDVSHPKSLDPPFSTYDRLTSAIRDRKIPMLIVHQGLSFYYKFKTFQEAFSYEPEKHWNKKRIWRLVYGPHHAEMSYFLPKECGWSSGLTSTTPEAHYFLMREDCYQRFRSAISVETEPRLFQVLWDPQRNPSESRPAFLYRKHQDDDPDEFPALPSSGTH